MANKRITELASASNLTVNDLLVLVNEAQTRKATIEDLITFLIAQGEFAQLDNGTIPPEQLPALTTTDIAEGSNKYYTAARVLAEILAGLNVQNSAVTSADSVLSALGKLQGQINAGEKTANKGAVNGYASLDSSGKVPSTQLPASVLGGVSYQGSWNAASALTAASASNKGWYYVVSANGSQAVDGISEWKIGDWAISNGTVWQKVDNSDPGILEALTGFTTGANSTVLATDTILSALQKVQGQINAREEVAKKGAVNGYASLDSTGKVPSAQLPSGITNVLTGFATGANSTVLASDTILAAFQKVQGQINARELTSKKGVANGYASLDGNTRLTKALLTKGQRALDLDTSANSSTTTSEVVVYSAPVNAAVLAAGDQVNVTAWFSSAANANAKTIKLYIHTSDSLGGTLVGTYTVPSGASSFKFERDISFLTATSAKAGAAPATSSINGTSNVADAAFTIPNITNTFYFVLSASGNSLTCDRVALEALYWTTTDPITG